MKRCYEIENYEYFTGCRERYNHCGNAKKGEDGVYYCPTGGRFDGYAGKCANIELAGQVQLAFFELKGEERNENQT